MDSTKIWVRGDTRPLFLNEQFEASVNYSDIHAVAIVESNRKSNKIDYVKTTFFNRQCVYLEIKTSKSSVLFLLQEMNKKTIRKMLIDLNKHLELVGNKIEMNIDEMVDLFVKYKRDYYPRYE